MKQSLADRLLSARVSLLWDNPFFGTLAVHLGMHETENPAIETFATDGKSIVYNKAFAETLTKAELTFIIAHEVLHVALEHHFRRQHRDPFLWNVAADYAINGELVESKVGTMPKGGLINAAYTGLGAEEIYEKLEKQQKGKGKGKPDPNAVGQGFGEVLDGANPHDQAAIAEARAENRARLAQAMTAAKLSKPGSISAGLSRMIESILEPKVDWRAVLRRFVDESFVTDYAWHRPNRRLLPHGLITPGTIADGIPEIVVAVDTSGSINDGILREFAAEIGGMFNDGTIDRLTVVYADAEVCHVENFERGDELRLHAKGGGGTAFADTFEWIRENRPDAKCAIYLTDLFVSAFGKAPPMPVIFAAYGDSKTIADLGSKVPFGETIHVTA